MKDKEKMRKYLQRDFELMLVLDLVILIAGIVLSSYDTKQLIVGLVDVALLGLGVYLAKKGGVAAGVIGLIVGILMILSGALITAILGIFMAIHSVIYLINLNKK